MTTIGISTVSVSSGATSSVYITSAFTIAGVVIGSLLTFVLRFISSRQDRRWQIEDDDRRWHQSMEGELQRWQREERKKTYAAFISANDALFNACVLAERAIRPDGAETLTENGRVAIEDASSAAATLFAEVQLVGTNPVIAKAHDLIAFHQSMARAAIERGARESNSAESNQRTLAFVSEVRGELGFTLRASPAGEPGEPSSDASPGSDP